MKRDELLQHLEPLTEHQDDVRLMTDGDLLGPGHKFWIGPGVAADTGMDSARVRRLKAIAAGEMQHALLRSFVPGENMIRSAWQRVSQHVGGSEFTWTVNAQKKKDAKLAEAILLAGYESGGIRAATNDFRDALIRDGAAGLLPRVPSGALSGGKVKTSDPIAAARCLRVEAALCEDVARWEDDETLTDVGVFRVPNGTNEPALYLTQVEGGLTVLYQVERGPEGDALTERYRLRLGGMIPVVSAKCPPLLTPAMLRLQMALSMGMTMMVKNTELMGFVERWMHNVQPVTGKDGNPLPIITGAGQTVFTRDPVATNKETGESKSMGQAKYERLDPVSAEPGEAAINRVKEEFYASAGQTHYLMGSDATASGEARKTAMASFAASLRPYQDAYRRAVQELLTLWLRMSCALSGSPGLLDDVTVEVKLTDKVTEPTAQDRAQTLAEWEKGLISHERALADRGELDPAGERKQIAREQEEVQAQAGTGGADAGHGSAEDLPTD